MTDVRVVSKWLRLSRHPGAMVVLALAVLTACQETPTETEDAAPITAARQASPQRPVRTAESAARFLAASAPEFGGMFLDDNGALVVWITNERGRGSVSAAIQRLRTEADPELSATPLFRIAKYSFTELAEWRDLLFDQVLGMNNAVMLDVNERRNRVVLGITAAGSNANILSELRRLGIPVGAVRIEVVPVPSFLERSTAASASIPLRRSHVLTTYTRPLRGGYQIHYVHPGRNGLCSLSFMALMGGQPRLITASHCSKDLWKLDATDMYQNLSNSGNKVGDELLDPPSWHCGFLGIYNCRYSDAAAYDVDNGVTYDVGRIARTVYVGTWPTETGSVQVVGHWDVVGPAVPTLMEGIQLQKVGRTSGWTSGDLLEICVDRGGLNFWGTARALCQYTVQFGADEGDSGGPVFRAHGPSTVYLVGLISGGDPGDVRVSPLSGIMRDLGSMQYWSVYVPDTPSVTISGPTVLPPGLMCWWTAYASGGVTPYSFGWSGLLSGGGASIEGVVYNSGELDVQVTDAVGGIDIYSLYITVDPGADEPLGCEV